jgi:adenylate cyclase
VLELRAQGNKPDEVRTWQLTPGTRYRLGRAPDVELAIPWDPRISRHHAEAWLHNGQLQVARFPESQQPIFYDGHMVERCTVGAQGRFVLGTTALELVEGSDPLPEQPLEERAFSPQQLRRIRYHDPENRIAVLTHLPEVIAGARTDVELYERVAQLLLNGITQAEGVSIVSCHADDVVVTRHFERRKQTAGEVRPSRRLVLEALQKQRTSVLHVWGASAPTDDPEPTLGQEFDWAFCTPVAGLADEPAGLYVGGQLSQLDVTSGSTLFESAQLEADVKFTELVAEFVAAVLKSRRLERQKAGLRQFFAPPILSALGDELDTTLLEPCERDVTVMFCDLRGFSQRAEHEANNLIGLLDRVSRALGVMTQQILKFGGVTGDFQGDAALGFWGWPLPSTDAAVDACRAALGIRAAFAKAAAQKDHPLADFSMGIGLAHGRAVAGKIGTAEQVKVTVFGPVVNLAHRLESMTKQLRAPILMDQAIASIVRERLPAAEGRCRRLAKVLPYGLETPVFVSELLPPLAEWPELTDEHLAMFERGVDAFQQGAWEAAYRDLHTMPSSDRAQDFLLATIMQGNRTAPPGWEGVLRLPAK